MEESGINNLISHKGKKLRKYFIEEKLSAIEYAKKHGNRSAARSLGIDEKRIREWRLTEEKFKVCNKPKSRFRLKGGGRYLTNEILEQKLLSFVENKRADKLQVTHKMMCREATKIFQSITEDDPEIKNSFKASEGFIQKFKTRHNLVYRRKTSISQKLPEDYIPRIFSFFDHTKNLRKKNKYKISDIIGCDETPVWFEGIGSTTIDKSGVNDVSILSTGHDKMRCTVMLSAKADGTKLKPFVVFKRRRKLIELEKKFPDIVIAYSVNGWMDYSLTSDFLQRVIGSFSFSRRLLVWDSYRCHIMDSIKKQLNGMKIDTAVIPGGCTKYIQPADVSWNKSFKSKYRENYNNWMNIGNHEYTSTGRMRAPPLEEILIWIRNSWSEIPTDQIKQSFISCGITTALDGSEDDKISCLRNLPLNRSGLCNYIDDIEDEGELEENEIIIDEEDEDL